MKLDFSRCQSAEHARIYKRTHKAMAELAHVEFANECTLRCAQELFDEMIGENEHGDFDCVARSHINATVEAVIGCILTLSSME